MLWTGYFHLVHLWALNYGSLTRAIVRFCLKWWSTVKKKILEIIRDSHYTFHPPKLIHNG